jgi:serine/threonine protein kinase
MSFSDLSYSDFIIIRELASGSFGTVHLAIYLGEDSSDLKPGGTYALKEMNTNDTTTLIELNVLEKIKDANSQQNILKYYCAFLSGQFTILVLEYILGDDLFKWLTSVEPYLIISELDIIKILKQVVSGLVFLKQNGIIHRDIKLENIMYEKNSGVVKIVDFGLSKLNQNSRLNQNFTSRLGTMQYKSPELNLNGTSSSEGDIWSLGILLYILVSGEYMFDDIRYFSRNRTGLEYVIHSEIEKLKCSDEIKGLIRDMLKVDSNERISLDLLCKRLHANPANPVNIEVYESKLELFESQLKAKWNYSLLLNQAKQKRSDQAEQKRFWDHAETISKHNYEKFIDDRLRTEGIIYKFFLCKQDNCQIKIETIGRNASGPKICHRCGISVCDTHSQTISCKLFKKHISNGNRQIKEHEKNTETGKIKTGVLGYVSYTGSSMTRRVSDKIRVCNLCAKYAQKEPTLVFDNLLGGKKKKPVKKKTYKKIIAGRKRVIHTGPKGGKYFIRSKKKVYIK